MLYRNVSEDELVSLIAAAVRRELQKGGGQAARKNDRSVPTGISVRHIHLTRDDVDRLFGRNYRLTPKKRLSQPGQYACEETLELIGPKGNIRRVRILGPERAKTQIEVAYSDARILGIDAPVRASGDVEGTPGIVLRGPLGDLLVKEGVIIADRHIHMTPQDAEHFRVKDGDRVSVRIDGVKPGIIDGVIIRVSDRYRLDFHIDTDDGNAFLLGQGDFVTVL